MSGFCMQAALSARAAKLLNGGQTVPKFSLELQPTCIVDDSDSAWFCIFLDKPGGFSAVTDVTFNVDPEPGSERLIVGPVKGAMGPDFICNEQVGSS
jgi:hypothetical protein